MSRSILEDTLKAIDSFVSGLGDVADLQARIEGDASALDTSFDCVIRQLHSLDSLEEIRFARLRHDQRPAAILRLDPVRESVLAALAEIKER